MTGNTAERQRDRPSLLITAEAFTKLKVLRVGLNQVDLTISNHSRMFYASSSSRSVWDVPDSWPSAGGNEPLDGDSRTMKVHALFGTLDSPAHTRQDQTDFRSVQDGLSRIQQVTAKLALASRTPEISLHRWICCKNIKTVKPFLDYLRFHQRPSITPPHRVPGTSVSVRHTWAFSWFSPVWERESPLWLAVSFRVMTSYTTHVGYTQWTYDIILIGWKCVIDRDCTLHPSIHSSTLPFGVTDTD